nr:hypothetical protein [Chroococcidiopsis sp. CCMEE 29]
MFIAGSSIFPTGVAANPTLTIVSLAIWLAGHVKKAMASDALTTANGKPLYV